MAIALSGNSDANKPDAGTSNAAATTTVALSTQRISTENNRTLNNNDSNNLNNNTSAKSACEMMGACTVCSDDQGTEENPLVYCDGCEVGVHQACYGIVSVPAGNWFCRRCEVGDTQGKIACELCPSQDGALKQTKDGKWAHVVCALYIPEVRFGNNNTMEPIETEHIHAERFNKSCYLCEEQGNSSKATYGAVMNCHKLGCKQSFHVTCAQTANLLCEEARPSSPDNVNYCGYCKHHFRKLKAGNRKEGKANSGAYNSSSSYLDSASDSSQDNDPRCNERTVQDKSSSQNNNKLPGSSIDQPMNTNSIKMTTATPAVASTATASTSLLEAPPKDQAIASTNKSATNTNSVNKPSTNLVSASTTQRKKKSSKDNDSSNASSGSGQTTKLGQSNNSITLLSSTSTTNEPFKLQQTTSERSDHPDNDPYNWSSDSRDQNNKSFGGNNSKTGKKKSSCPEASNLQIKASKNSHTATSNTVNSININLQKVSSPNLSVSTSPSLASPSNSTRSTSNSSNSSLSTATATSSSSSSSTVSNSPSPALLSPNITNRTPTSRLESPLASGSKTGNSNTANRQLSPSESSLTQNSNLSTNQTHISTRINLDDPKSDLKKVGSSLLSTVLPVVQDQSIGQNAVPMQQDSTRTPHQAQHNYTPEAALPSANDNRKGLTTGSHVSNLNATSTNAQPLVPPLIIPTSLAGVGNIESPASKATTAKSSRTSAKTARKKSTETNESTQKSEPKAKPSRSRKTTSTVADNNPTTETGRTETKRAAKSKTAAKSTNIIQPNLVNTEPTSNKSQTLTESAPNKRKSRSASNESNLQGSAAKKPRRKKADSQASDTAAASSSSAAAKTNQLAAKTPLPPVTLILTSVSNAAPLTINTPLTSRFTAPSLGSHDYHDVNSRFLSPMISPYANLDPSSAPSLSRSSLSRLFTSTAMADTGGSGLSGGNNFQSNLSDDIGKAFEELRDNTWSHLSKSILEQAQQFDIPSLIGTLYMLRTENEKLINKVRDLTIKRDQLVAMNARLDLPGPILTQHLNQTSPNFSSVAVSLGNSPKASPSPGAAMVKPPLVGPYNHVPHSSLGAPSFLDRSSPLVNQAHPGINSIKPSTISTPSPPLSALMAHSAGSRSGLTVNQPYMSNVFPPTNPLNALGTNVPGSSYYPRQ